MSRGVPSWVDAMKGLSDMRDLCGFDPSPKLISYWDSTAKMIGKPIGLAHIEAVREIEGNPLRLPGNTPRATASIRPGDPVAVVLLSKRLRSESLQITEAVTAHELTHLRMRVMGYWTANVEPSPRYMVDADFSPYVNFSSTLEDVVVNRTIAEEGFDAFGAVAYHLEKAVDMFHQPKPDYPGRNLWDEDYHMLCSACLLLEMTSRRLRCVGAQPDLLDDLKKLVESKSPESWQWYASIVAHVDRYDLRDPAQHNACLVWLSRQLKAAPRVRFFLEGSVKRDRIPDSEVDAAMRIGPTRQS